MAGIDNKHQSNPVSTGGGPYFETRVQSAFVVIMLTGRIAPCLPAWPIVKIKLQGKYAGFSTGNCIILCAKNRASIEKQNCLPR